MRLLLINYEYPPVGAGAGNATAQIARALVELGHSALVLTGAYGALPERSVIDGVKVTRVHSRRTRVDRSNMIEMASYVFAASRALPHLIRTEKPDSAIVFFSMPCGPLGLLARWWAGIPYVLSLRGGDVPGTESRLRFLYALLAPLRRMVMRRATAVVANSSGLKSLSEAADPVDVEVIVNGVDVEFFRPVGERGERPFTFLFVGRFQPQKNLAFLLRAIAELRSKTCAPFRFTILGDGSERAELQRQCTEAGLDDLVKWRGWCAKDELLVQYQAADCFVNPSLYEGMPNAVLEAMACGLPVLASNVPGNDALVVPDTTGILFNLADTSGLVHAMYGLLDDCELAQRMGHAGRLSVSRDHSWLNVAARYVSLFGRDVGSQ